MGEINYKILFGTEFFISLILIGVTFVQIEIQGALRSENMSTVKISKKTIAQYYKGIQFSFGSMEPRNFVKYNIISSRHRNQPIQPMVVCGK